jgi:hypothetical protein
MLAWLGYGAAARVSGKCDDAGGAEPVKAFALNAEPSHGSGQLPENAGEMPVAGRATANAANDAGIGDAVEGLVEVAEIKISRLGSRHGTGRARGLIIKVVFHRIHRYGELWCGAILPSKRASPSDQRRKAKTKTVAGRGHFRPGNHQFSV